MGENELIARCREALAASDKMAKAAIPGSWCVAIEIDGVHAGMRTVVRARSRHWRQIGEWRRVVTVGQTRPHHDHEAEANVDHIAANDPSTRLALNRALTVVLDGIEATLAKHPDESRGLGTDNEVRCICGLPVDWLDPCPHLRDAQASLATIAQALGVAAAPVSAGLDDEPR